MAEPTIKLIYAVTLDGTETVTWDEGGGVLTATLDAGTYWCHNSSGITDYPSLYDHIATKMTAGSTSAYTFQVSSGTPTLSTAWSAWGITISTVAPSSWTWRPAGTINALEVMGWLTTDSNTPSVANKVTSPRTYRGAWRSPESPSRWTSTPHEIITPSTEYVERTDAYFFDQGSRRTRQLMIEFVTGAHVFAHRADLAAFAATGQLATGDDNNALEYMWQWARSGGDIIVVWYEEVTDLDLGVDSNGQYEVARLNDQDQMRHLGEMLRMIRAGAELYTVTIDLVRSDDTNYDWNQ